MRLHSITGFTVRNLKFLMTTELKHPNTTPVKSEPMNKKIKLAIMMKGVPALKVLFSSENSMTVLKRMIQTASLVMPSPNTRLNSFG